MQKISEITTCVSTSDGHVVAVGRGDGNVEIFSLSTKNWSTGPSFKQALWDG